MKKLFKKKQLVLAALVFMLAAAIYVNWQYNKVDSNPPSATDDNLGDAEFVSTDNVEIDDEDNSYISAARKEREENREEILDELEELQKDVKNSDEAITSAVNKQVEIMGYSETELNIETLVKAKGFKDCLTVVGEESINVIVCAKSLEKEDILQIQDIVLSQKNISLDSIKVINVE